MNMQEAKLLCKKAHKGQWRRPKHIDNKKYLDNQSKIDRWLHDMNGLNNRKTIILPSGEQIRWDDENDRIIISEPYCIHPFEIAEMMDTDEEKITGYLHDIVEDTHYNRLGKVADNSKFYVKSSDTLDEVEITENIYNALQLLAKSKNQPYQEYIENISENKLAAKVKIADIACNLLDNPSENQKKKYRQAMKTLLKVI